MSSEYSNNKIKLNSLPTSVLDSIKLPKEEKEERRIQKLTEQRL
jgi:hypothetical protein